MAPNKSFVTASVMSVEPYTAQQDFYLLQLQVISAKKTEQPQMPGAEKGEVLKAIVAAEMISEQKIKIGSKVECELKKVSVDLWRVIDVKVKSKKEK